MHEIDPQLDGVVVDLPQPLRQLDLVDPEADAVEAELPSDVDAAQLHVHGHNLHRADATEMKHIVRCCRFVSCFIGQKN